MREQKFLVRLMCVRHVELTIEDQPTEADAVSAAIRETRCGLDEEIQVEHVHPFTNPKGKGARL